MSQRASGLLFGALLLAACQPKPDLPSGPAAYSNFPAVTPGISTPTYVIGPMDVVAVTVFQEPDLSASDLQVDTSGNIVLPLVGQVQAAGLTSVQLAQQLDRQLVGRYLTRPQVTVVVQSSASQRVTVEGTVVEPGVYDIKGRTTLLDALAFAKGPTRVANLSQVVVFREINGRTEGAMFDVKKINRGEAEDPEILGSDTVIVGLSYVKGAWRDFLTAAPIIAAFRPLGY